MPDAPLPDWPAAMRSSLAAAYLDVSETWFRDTVAPALKALRPSQGVVLYRRADLDRWLDQQAGKAPAYPEARGAIHEAIQSTLSGRAARQR